MDMVTRVDQIGFCSRKGDVINGQNKDFTWYKTALKAPLGNKLVAVDILGLGKGMAWVNGHSLGRHWPSYIVDK
ncbi:hypothetical protein GOBAR_DD32769 [Gossypium barbadense]|nr:hypothetical protein GOBAR_DD32769 [Gossypium barbadense]